MKNNVISLDLFDLNQSNSPYEIVKDVKAKTGWLSHNNPDAYFKALNKASVKSKSEKDKFLEMYFSATENICKDKFNF